MKLVFFLPSGTKGGAEQLIFQLIMEYQKQGHQTVLFFLTQKNVNSFIANIDKKKSIIYRCPVNREIIGYFILPFLCMYHTIKYKKSNLIFSTHVHLNALVALFRKFHIIKSDNHIARESTLIFKRFSGTRLLVFKLFYYFGYRHIPNIICQTELMRDELLYNLPWVKKYANVVVFPNPINLTEVRIKALLPFTKPSYEYIVAAGSLTYVKGFDILIKSFDKCLKVFPDLRLLILGEGSLRKNLESLIRDLRIDNNVLLLGWQKNVYPFFKHANVCVVSSRIEGFPNVLLQEMACCDFVVSTLCAGGIEKIPGIYLCATEDIEEMADSIIKALSSRNVNNRFLYDKFLEDKTIENYVFKLNMLN